MSITTKGRPDTEIKIRSALDSPCQKIPIANASLNIRMCLQDCVHQGRKNGIINNSHDHVLSLKTLP